MSRARGVVGAAAAALALAPGTARAVTTIDGTGVWTLGRLGVSGPLDIPLIGRDGSRGLPAGQVSVPYRLPAGARQGPRRWYLIRVHAAIAFAPTGGPGTAYLVAATNERAASQAKFAVPSGISGVLRYSLVDIVEGLTKRSTRGRVVVYRNENFLQNRGVRGGPGVLTFGVDQIGAAARVQSARILPDSGIVVSRAGPAPLTLRAGADRRRVRVGSTFTVRVTIGNPGRRTARQLSFGASTESSRIRVKGPDGRDLDSLRPGRRATATITFRARRPGRATVMVEADSASTGRSKAIPIVVVARE